MSTTHPLSLAAATILDADHATAVEVARAAGFDALGLRWDFVADREVSPERLRRSIDDAGLRLLDLEVVRLGPNTPFEEHRRLIEIAAHLRPAWLLTVSHHPDPSRTRDELLLLAESIAPFGCSISLEFMAFTAIATLGQALSMAAAVRADGGHNIGVLVDALHLDRSSGSPADLRGTSGGDLSYLQLCDATAPPSRVRRDPGQLAFEARNLRRFPGEGTLPLTELVAQVPAVLPVSVEVQSREWARRSPLARAHHAMTTVRGFVE